jgi:hypothetical protein
MQIGANKKEGNLQRKGEYRWAYAGYSGITPLLQKILDCLIRMLDL